MGTCEDRCPSIDLDNEIILDAGSKGPIHTDCDDSSEVLIQRLEDSHIDEKEEEQVRIEEEKGFEEVGGDDEEADENGWSAREEEEHENDEEQQNENRGLPIPYPLRPNAEDCSFYMKTGSCKFGFNCRFNHPIGRVNQVVDLDIKDYDGQRTDGIGKIECKYYSAPGGCKFGETCRYSHFKEDSNEQVELNFLGLPIRKGERECPYYMRNGSCGYGANCRFHHPDPTAVMEEPKNVVPHSGALQGGKSFTARNIPDTAPLTPSMPQTISNSSSSDSYVPWMNPIPQGMPHHQQSPYNQYQAPVSLADTTMNSRPGYSMNNPLNKVDSFSFNQQQIQGEDFPQRVGEPDCDHFMRTGTCKFGSNCRFHHPRTRLYNTTPNGAIHNATKEATHFTYQTQTQTQMEEYPERPGEPECSFFMRTGDCKYKSQCKYHHPKAPKTKLSAPSTYGMNGLSSRMVPILPHEARKLPDLYPSHSNQMGKPSHIQPTRTSEEFPDRPGQPECDYFMKTGDCKFKYTCRYHHPKTLRSQVYIPPDLTSLPAFNEKGLPLRPGAKTCRNYEQLGICKYGPRCLFDHPSSFDSGALPESSAPQSPPGNVSGWDDDWVIG